MKKFSLFAVAAAVAMAVAAAPADAATKKKSKSGKSSKAVAAKVEKRAGPQPMFVNAFHGCVNSFGVFAAVGAVGCGAVYAVPVMVEGFVAPRRA